MTKTEVLQNVQSRRLADDFSRLVEKHHKQAYNVAYRITNNREDAEDLCQDTFLRAFRFFHNYNSDMPFESWLYKIMSNIHIDKIRRKPKINARSIDQPIVSDNGESCVEIPDVSALPDEIVLSSDLEDRLMSVLNTLPDIFKKTIIYADIEMMSYEEIADITNTNIGTVRSRLHRGRRMLREVILEKGVLDS